MTNHSYATVARQLGERAAHPNDFDPWVFFPRGWDWPWLSYQEAQTCVSGWKERLQELARGRVLVVHSAHLAPETLLLRLASDVSGAIWAESSSALEEISGTAGEIAEFAYEASPIRPKLEIQVQYGLVDSEECPSPEAEKRGTDFVIEGHRSRRRVVLATGVLPSAKLLSAVLEADAALVLEPVRSGLIGALLLRPDVLFLAAGESPSVLEALLQSGSRQTGVSKPTRRQKRIDSAIRSVVQVIVQDEADLRLFERAERRDGWNPRVVSSVTE